MPYRQLSYEEFCDMTGLGPAEYGTMGPAVFAEIVRRAKRDAVESLKIATTELDLREFAKYLGMEPFIGARMNPKAVQLFNSLRMAAESLGAFDEKNLEKLLSYQRPRSAEPAALTG